MSYDLTYHPDIGAGFQFGIDTETSEFGINFQLRNFTQLSIRGQTDSNDNVISFDLQENEIEIFQKI